MQILNTQAAQDAIANGDYINLLLEIALAGKDAYITTDPKLANVCDQIVNALADHV